MAHQQGSHGQPPQHAARSARGFTVAMVAIGLIGLVSLGAAGWILLTAGDVEGGQPAARPERARVTVTQPAATPTAGHTVTFEVESRDRASSLAHVTISAESAATPGLRGGSDTVELPWSTTMQLEDPLPGLTMWVINNGADAVLVCRIRVDGDVVVEKSSTSGYIDSAFCSLPAGGA